MNCNKCQKANRPSAKYCKWCGEPMVASSATDSSASPLIGKDNIAKRISEIVASAQTIARQGQQRGISMRLDMCFAITGQSGTGKNIVAEEIAKQLYQAGIIKKPIPHVVKSTDYAEFVKKTSDSIKPIGGNVLIIDDAHKHCPSSRADSICELDKILQDSKDWGADPNKPVLIFIGDDDLLKYFESNPASRALVRELFQVPALDVEDLTEITCRQLTSTYSCTVTDDTRLRISRVIAHAKRKDPGNFPYGHFATNLAYQTYINASRSGNLTLSPDLVPGEQFIPKTLDDVLKEFDKFVGVEEIKKTIKEIAVTVEEARRKGGDKAVVGSVRNHFLFVGNPGTGKTTMARLFGEALSAMGALPSGQFIEVDAEKLISQYIGETPKLVRQAVNNAMGGVLFIDEAYNLCKDKDDSYGLQAVNTLLKDCEDLRGKFVCIIAGYPIEMQRFMGLNSGLERRFDRTINFRDYTGAELLQIFRNMAASGDSPVKLGSDMTDQIGPFFDKMYATRTKRFGNAGTVRDTLDKAKAHMRTRIMENPSDEPDTLVMADLSDNAKRTVEDILASFDDLVGMSAVKEQIRKIAKSVEMQQRMVELGIGGATVTNIHMVLTGNPGTGKTTVATRLGQVFKAIGVIPTDKVVVKKAEDIFDSYSKSAGPNMTQAVEDAMGGVLFIDEAYNLMPVNTPGTVDANGQEAVNALMTCMSERAGQFITVMAGYKIEIEEFIRNANPGLARRITHRINIPDYSADELTTIYLQQVKKAKFKITEDAEKLLRRKIDEMVTAKDEKFGNAGTIIKLFDETKERHFDRLDVDASVDDLITITPADIPYDAPKKLDMDEIMAKLDQLEGLDGVKSAIRDLTDTLISMQSRAADTDEKFEISLDHYMFLGNPGTGKTTVARIMGDIFYSLGLLPSNKVIELTSKDLKAAYLGQTSAKAHDAMMRGMGGVVFIDEAYSITQGDGPTGFGREAVAEILLVMENYKNKFITIAAGYPREMAEWLESNSGLSSRFTTKIMFEDYNAEQLCHIAKAMFDKRKLKISPEAEAVMLNHFTYLVNNKTKNFANAREARNYVDKVIINQGRRLRQEMKLPDFTTSRYYILEPVDMKID